MTGQFEFTQMMVARSNVHFMLVALDLVICKKKTTDYIVHEIASG